MKCGNFDTNATALKQRIQTHERYGANDLNPWIFDHFQLQEGLSVLELGCGTGKQTLPMAKLIGSTGHIVAVDISQEALESVFRSAQELKLENRISVVCKGIDGIGKYVPKPVDRVLSSYSLYYAESPDAVFRDLHRLLNPEGILFFCGPAKDNNDELKRFHYSLAGTQPPKDSGASEFMEGTSQRLARELFATVEVFSFDNPLRFDSADALYAYWAAYNLYDVRLENEFKAMAKQYFQSQQCFETIKRVVGVRAAKRA